MGITVPLQDAFGDSPAFRAAVQAQEASLNNVDASIKKMTNIAEKLMDMTKDYSAKYAALAEEFQALGGNEEDPAYEDNRYRAGTTLPIDILVTNESVLADIERSRMIAASQLKDVFIDPLNAFVAAEIQPAKKAGKEYQHAQDQYLNSIGKYMSKRPIDKGIEESARDAAEARKIFHIKTVEYGMKLNDVDIRRKYELVENIVALAYTNFSFFHQGYDTLKDIEPSMRDLTAVLQKTRQEHTRAPGPVAAAFLLPPDSYDPTSPASEPRSTRTATTIYKAGYLYKKSSSKMRTVWHRRFFELGNAWLGYFSLEGKDDAKTTIDLRICMVKETPSPERRFCFDLVSPSKTMTLQAQNDEQMKDWISALQAAIGRSISEEGANGGVATKPTFGDPSHNTSLLRDSDGTSGTPASPSSRRAPDAGDLLARVSAVKSLSLDRWDQEGGDILLLLGNDTVNAIFEGGLAAGGGVKPKPDDDSQDLTERQQIESNTLIPFQAYLARNDAQPVLPPATHAHLPQLLDALAHGYNVNEQDMNGRTLLHKASADAVLVEFLLSWGADGEKQDTRGWTPLHSAVDSGNVNAVLAFLRRSARTDVPDIDGKLPVDLARAKARELPDSEPFVHITTLLGTLQASKSSVPAAATWKSSEDWDKQTTTAGNETPADLAQEAPASLSSSSPLDIKSLPTLPSSTDPWADERTAWGT
ncbi:Arf-GAP with coiled-coil, ANK repeat and PH domain-containing protein 2 [Thoreauomyces humboldtii]|nr:Arf-GAP with coiled-coil, ANK repeat and PH domain-containing protein 2 [Thoreauomyces humboldtii]